MSSGFVTPESLAADERSDDGVLFYGVGICAASCCVPADLPLDVIVAAADRRWPTGLAWGWSISEEPTFASGHPNPCPCERTPGRVHRLLSC